MSGNKGPWTIECVGDRVGRRWWVMDEEANHVVRDVPKDRARLIAAAPRLRDALRGMMALIPQAADWCDNPEYPILQMGACGICPSCLAWQAATDALKACEEVTE